MIYDVRVRELRNMTAVKREHLKKKQQDDNMVENGYAVFREAVEVIDAYCNEMEQDTLTIVIDGMCASGKTTLGVFLQKKYGGNLFHMDDFFLQPNQRTRERLEEPGGNVDYERFREEITNHLRDEQGLSYGIYDCRKQRIVEKVHVPYQTINIIEGSYSAHPYLGELADIQFFLEIDAKEQIRRIRERNGSEMWERFEKLWIPLENKYFEAYHIKEKSICLRTDEIEERE